MQPRFFRRRRFGVLLAVPVSIALSALPSAAQTVTYQVKFQGNWTLESTPGGVVAGAHFTTLIGGVHGSGVTFWKVGEQASPGVELVAELGSTGTFRSEVLASTHTLSVIEQRVSGGGTGSATFTIDVTRTHPLVTLLSMIGPSPDWFVGVTGESLLDGADQWRQSHVVNLYPHDAGTEDGTEFSLSNPDTDPQGVITNIAGTGKFSNVPMAWLTFTRLTPSPEPSVSLSASPNPVDEGESVTVTASLSEALSDDVTVPLVVESGTAEPDDFGSLASITITGGQTTGTGTISTVEDGDADDETFTVSLGTLPPEVTAGDPSSVEVTIRDDDGGQLLPAVSLSASPNPVDEGRPVTVTASLSEALSDDVTIPLELAPGTAESDDFGSLASITITGGQTIGAGTISTFEDADADHETFTVALGTLPPQVTAGDPSFVEVTIQDDEEEPPPPTVRLSASPNPVDEGRSVTVTARLSEAVSDDVTIPLVLASGTAEPGDFGSLASITITGGQTAGAGTISTVEDADADDETFTVSLGTLPPEVRAGDPSSVEVTIRDDNPPAVRATCQPCTVPRGGEVRLRAEASDPDGDSISYEWSAAQGRSRERPMGRMRVGRHRRGSAPS